MGVHRQRHRQAGDLLHFLCQDHPHAKAVNFGIVYGISAFSLAQDIGGFQSEAKAYIDAYLEKYHGVREYMTQIIYGYLLPPGMLDA